MNCADIRLQTNRLRYDAVSSFKRRSSHHAGVAMSGERIAKVIARAGLASRRNAEKLIRAGRVEVDGKRLASSAFLVKSTDSILVDGEPLPAKDKVRLWRFHKPAGIITSSNDARGRKTVHDILPEELPRVVTIGRLDLNSEGLLLLTNDGGLKRQLELPATGWIRKYRVRADGSVYDGTLDELRNGVIVDGQRLGPFTAELDRQQGSNAWLTVGLRSGRNREVRRAMDAVGLKVNRLIRISFGPFILGRLPPGVVQEVSAGVLRNNVKGFRQQYGE